MDRHNNFDTLRLVAATSVIFSHAFLLGEGTQDPEPLMRLTGGQTILGVVGVFVFFTISGFLVTQSFDATGSPGRFLIKRALRIYPGLLVCLVVSAFAMGPFISDLPAAAYFRGSGAYTYVTSNFSMLMPANTLPGVRFSGYSAGSVVNGPLWTLPCEVVMYLVVFALGILRALDLRVMLALVALGMVCLWFDTSSSDYFIGGALWLLPFFAAGMALYRLRDKGIFRARVALVAFAGLVLSVPLNAFILLFPLFGSYLVIYLALEQRLPFFNAARFGDLSYGLYIYGWPVEQVLVRLHGGAMAWPTLFALALPITAALAFASWHLIEARALRLKPMNAPRAKVRLAAAQPRT
jgi:peptidoglycan/LPS O-acetylase OafA/YrhL